MTEQIKKEAGPFCPEAEEGVLESECKICYLEFDTSFHYPMLACSAQHILCYTCFLQLAKQQFLQCPFCKRNTNVDNVIRFKYALTASAKYHQLWRKYLQLIDILNKDQLEKQMNDYKQTLTSLEDTNRDLKIRLKNAEDRNRQLTNEMKLSLEKYTAFEREIIECKYNEIIIKNQLTMIDYELKKTEKEKAMLADQLTDANKEVLGSNIVIAQLIQKTELLGKELQALKLEKQTAKSKNIGSDCRERSQHCPEIDQLQDLSQRMFLTKKKSKSQYRIKTEVVCPESAKEKSLKKKSNCRKIVQKSKAKNQLHKLNKIYKI